MAASPVHRDFFLHIHLGSWNSGGNFGCLRLVENGLDGVAVVVDVRRSLRVVNSQSVPQSRQGDQRSLVRNLYQFCGAVGGVHCDEEGGADERWTWLAI